MEKRQVNMKNETKTKTDFGNEVLILYFFLNCDVFSSVLISHAKDMPFADCAFRAVPGKKLVKNS